jgi:aldehyde:ferredoxin oxidoreductase
MPYGYNGKILRADLTTGAMNTEEPGEIVYRTYLGGGGLALDHHAVTPPSTGKATPLMNAASSEAR